MKHPAYHLRPNKAVDRLTLIEAIRRLDRLSDGGLSDYTYYGLGGPYLEDFRLLYELCPEVKLVSIEENEETFKRQKFHLPCGTVRLEKAEFKSFLARYSSNDEKSIFWLDYTKLRYGHFEEFMALLGKLTEGSMLKVTLRAEPTDFADGPIEAAGSGAARFRSEFGGVLPDPAADPPRHPRDFARLLQGMLQVAAQRTLSGTMPLVFLPIASFYYSDGTWMYTLTGIVWQRGQEKLVHDAYEKWECARLDWAEPRRIDIPALSTKERLHLQEHLPCRKGNAGKTLRGVLGYLIDESIEKTEEKLNQYADFHRYFPFFVRAVP